MKRTALKRKTGIRRNSKLQVVGHSDASELRRRIQALLREIGILRDGGCFLRYYPNAGGCGGLRNDGTLILQFDHLHSRVHAISFADPRMGVCVCRHHHITWKKQYPAQYEECARHFIGHDRRLLLDTVREDRFRSHKVDLRLAELALKQELKELQNS